MRSYALAQNSKATGVTRGFIIGQTLADCAVFLAAFAPLFRQCSRAASDHCSGAARQTPGAYWVFQ